MVAVRDLGGRERLDVHLGGGLLEPGEPRVDPAPTGADEVDEQGEIVDARVTLGEEVALDAFETADRLVQKTADLGDVPSDREDLRSNAVAHCGADVLG